VKSRALPFPSSRLERLAVAALLALAAAIRLGHLSELRADPFIDRPIMDAEFHDLWARTILEERPFVSQVFFRAPLYPHLLAGVYRLFGPGPWAPRALQMGMGLVSLLIMYRLARRVVGRRGALFALSLGALYDLMPYYEGELLLPAVLVLLALLAMERVVAFLSERRARDAVLAGALLGLMAVARPNALAVVPGLALLIGARSRSRRDAAAFALSALILPIAVTAVNGVRGGDPVFIASQAGVNFYIGNHRGSNGWSAVAPDLRPDWWGGYEDMIRIPEREAGRALKASEVSGYWTRRGLDEIAREPGWWLGHLARKTYLWFGSEELSNNKDLAFWKERFSVIRHLPVRYAHLVPLAVLGLLFVPWRSALPLVLFVGPYAASFVLFFVTSRYRLTTVPFLAVLAGGALDGLARLARHRAFWALAGRLLLLAALTLFLSSGLAPVQQPTFAISYMEIGRREMERARWADAAAAFREALGVEPRNFDARHDLGVALREGGDPGAALVELSAVAAARGDAGTWNNVGLTLAALGRRAEARGAYERAIVRDPSAADAWLNLALLRVEEGNFLAALEALDRGTSLRGEDAVTWYHRGVILSGLGRTGEARAAFERSLSLMPDHPEARARLEELRRAGTEPETGDPGTESPSPPATEAGHR